MIKNSQIHVLGIVGSPRRGGNTEILVDKILSSAENKGAKIEKVILNKLDIKPCQACDNCSDNRECIYKDDMVGLLNKMKLSQIWILGTPIYWWGPTAQFKTFIDRWYGIEGSMFKGKQIILVIPLGGGHVNYARHTVGMLEDILSYLDMKLFTKVIAPGVMSKGDVLNKTNIIIKAQKVGLDIVDKFRNKII